MDIDVSKLPATSQFKVDRLFVTVYKLGSLQEPSFQGFVKSISSSSTKGPFDILPTHENFITQFSQKLQIVPETAEPINYDNCSGVIEVANNVVKIFMKKKEVVHSAKNWRRTVEGFHC